MKEINIAKVLANKRREKGVTQDDIADYIGVSKASVSKWETEQSYPDITFLPQLASYFNITIDELIGYAPQMSKENIKKLYLELSQDFAKESFDKVLSKSRNAIKKYYSCFPLLLEMAGLLINHAGLAIEKPKQEAVLNEAIDICSRIKDESGDPALIKDAQIRQAACYLMLNQPGKVLELYGEEIRPMPQEIESISQAYLMLGNMSKAKEATQICMYQHLIYFLGLTPQYLLLNSENINKVEEILHRTLGVTELYNINKLHPTVMMQIYLSAAQVYANGEKTEKALEMLKLFTDVCVSNLFPCTLHGDSYFDCIDSWMKDFPLGTAVPRSESVIKKSLLESVKENPGFAILKDNINFKNIVSRLESIL